MSSGAAIRRQDAVLKMAAVSALLALLVVTLDAVRFHAVPLVAGEHVALDAHTMMLLGLLAIEAPVRWGIARCLRRQLQLQRRLRGVESVGREAIAGAVVQIVRGRRPVAFCAGLLRPRIYVTEAALEQLDAAQLRAVVAHELGHARRRDPLRMAVADVVAGGFWFIAPLRRVAVRQASVADLAADAAALRTAGGSPQALASALLALGYADPERIEQLVGRPPRAAPALLLAAAVLAAAALALAALGLTLAPVDPELPGVLVPLLLAPAVAALWASGGGVTSVMMVMGLAGDRGSRHAARHEGGDRGGERDGGDEADRADEHRHDLLGDRLAVDRVAK
jgi:hypothetical protein